MSPLVKASADLAAGCRITLGGPLDPALMARIIEVRVETTVGLPDVCVVRLAEDEVTASSGQGLKVIDDARFKLGAPFRVALAAAAGTAPEAVFDGEITTVEAELSAGGGGPLMELVVTAHDRSHRMHRKSTPRTFRQVTVSDVARKVAGEHGVKVGKLFSPGGPNEILHQANETDWAFLSRLVREHGGELDVAEGTLSIIDPSAQTAPVAELVFGEGLQSFRARVSSLSQVEKVEVRGWDPKQKAQILGTARTTAASSVEKAAVDQVTAGTSAVVTTARVTTKAQADAHARGLAVRVGHERVQGEAVSTGNPRLLAGAAVTIKGVGKRFSGVHRIVSAVHLYGFAGYETRLTLGAGGRPLAESVRSGGQGRDFAGHLVIGVVTDNNDADKLARVKVRYPTLGAAVESGWARVAREAAGAARGGVALPHVNDEVIIGFEHGDIHRPFVLGALFNGVDKPGADLVKATTSYAARFPRDLDVATKQKAIVAADRGVTVGSAQGPMELSAGTEMKLTASAAGPPSAVTIQTTGQIKAKGDLGVEITAMGPIKISSQAPVTVESSAALQLKGTAIQVQATGVLQLSGATVMIG